MTNKHQFIMFLYLRCIAAGTEDSVQLVDRAVRIPESAVPPCPINAATVIHSVAEGRSRPYKWMSAAGLKPAAPAPRRKRGVR